MIKQASFLLIGALLAFSGCSNKEYYTPEQTVNDWPVCKAPNNSAEAIVGERPKVDDVPAWPTCKRAGVQLVTKGAQGAVARRGLVVEKSGVSGYKIPDGERFLGSSGGWFLSTGIDGNVTLHSAEGNETKRLSLEKTVAAAAVEGDYLAVLFSSNDLGIYRLSTGKSYYKLPGTPATAVDVRIANPYFLGNLVVFPTLDGRLVVVNYEEKELLRSTVVSTETYFDNIFYFKVIGDTMVAATPNRLFCLSDKERREKLDLRDVVFDESGIWAATKEGEVIHLTTALQPVAKQKFPFAHFLGMIVGKEKLYLLEKEGYLIVMDKAMTQTEVYSIALDDGISFTGEKAFYVRDKIISVEE
ncbi:hypothetical protein WCX18_04810 [Sulfurimonas sp. HSL1-2]|uniref:hypothetical protein n=1 Tax=Thiomicrolovo zhangzhouensis TaxID=3131933 RepID=UPI0031F9E41A